MHLERINENNWRQAVFLTTDPTRTIPLDEEWLCNNAFSILQSIFEPVWQTRLLSHQGKYVGFVMYGLWEHKNAPLFCRFMIDEKLQGKGLGSLAVPVVVSQMRQDYPGQDLYLTLDPANLKAVRLYEKAGFVNTGETLDGEQIYLYRP